MLKNQNGKHAAQSAFLKVAEKRSFGPSRTRQHPPLSNKQQVVAILREVKTRRSTHRKNGTQKRETESDQGFVSYDMPSKDSNERIVGCADKTMGELPSLKKKV